MSDYQQVYRKFWTDIKVQEHMSPNDRYMFIYLLTNPLCNILGCYEIGFKHIEIETGLTHDEAVAAVNNLVDLHIIDYCFDCNEVLIFNYAKHNWSASPKLDGCILRELPNVKVFDHRDYLANLYNARPTVKEPYYE